MHEHITSALAELQMCQVLTSQGKSRSILRVGEGPDNLACHFSVRMRKQYTSRAL